MSEILGWWFGGDVLPNGDGRAVRVGETLTVEGPLVLGGRGLHLSERALDALRYAKTSVVWRVSVPEGAEILRDKDKLCVRARTHLVRLDAEPVLWEFARWCALQVTDAWTSLESVRRYLETGDKGLWASAANAALAAAVNAEWVDKIAVKATVRGAQRRQLGKMLLAAIATPPASVAAPKAEENGNE